jgi:hypothetical protein
VVAASLGVDSGRSFVAAAELDADAGDRLQVLGAHHASVDRRAGLEPQFHALAGVAVLAKGVREAGRRDGDIEGTSERQGEGELALRVGLRLRDGDAARPVGRIEDLVLRELVSKNLDASPGERLALRTEHETGQLALEVAQRPGDGRRGDLDAAMGERRDRTLLFMASRFSCGLGRTGRGEVARTARVIRTLDPPEDGGEGQEKCRRRDHDRLDAHDHPSHQSDRCAGERARALEKPRAHRTPARATPALAVEPGADPGDHARQALARGVVGDALPLGHLARRETVEVAEHNRTAIGFLQGQHAVGEAALEDQALLGRLLVPDSFAPRRARLMEGAQALPAAPRTQEIPQDGREPSPQRRSGVRVPGRSLEGHSPGLLDEVVGVLAVPDQPAREGAYPGRLGEQKLGVDVGPGRSHDPMRPSAARTVTNRRIAKAQRASSAARPWPKQGKGP